ncbi:LEM domain-containing protein 1 [Salarias fasciatus]|uniref:LEM domain-containing protein 1 n=1 Tax=Salarias fasciatus TaxID=181472 RepID=UPI0011765899|nr:lamina-associated polypeptide 2, isoforms beta/delta/epsilon/gamma-like [Salarias fasciatus]
MPFVENPAHLSKSRLRSDLVAHNVPLPPAASKKEALVKLHEKHIDQRRAADFSSDEEEEEEDRHKDGAEAREPIDLRCLTDDELRATLLKYGFKAGPIVASTRTLYEKNLRNLLLSDGYELLNEENITVTYSDSEEEGEEEEKEGNGDQEDEESGSEETSDESEQVQQESSEAATSRKKESSSMKKSRDALKSSTQAQSNCMQIPAGITGASSKNQRAGLASGATSGCQPDVSKGHPSFTETFSITEILEKESLRHSHYHFILDYDHSDGAQWEQYAEKLAALQQEYTEFLEKPKKDILKDLLPDTQATPSGIYVTCRKPIKGAARRPVQYAYPDSPVSPATFERREVERRLVPMHIRILVFFFLVFILYIIYVNV